MAKEEIKEKKKESLISKIIWIVVLVLAFGWVTLFLIDFFTVKSGKEPHFCITKEIRDHTDGSVEVCKGLGYVVYEYDREEITGLEFGPFWTPERETLED